MTDSKHREESSEVCIGPLRLEKKDGPNRGATVWTHRSGVDIGFGVLFVDDAEWSQLQAFVANHEAEKAVIEKAREFLAWYNGGGSEDDQRAEAVLIEALDDLDALAKLDKAQS